MRKLIGEKVSQKLKGRPSGRKGISNPEHSVWMKENGGGQGRGECAGNETALYRRRRLSDEVRGGGG